MKKKKTNPSKERQIDRANRIASLKDEAYDTYETSKKNNDL